MLSLITLRLTCVDDCMLHVKADSLCRGKLCLGVKVVVVLVSVYATFFARPCRKVVEEKCFMRFGGMLGRIFVIDILIVMCLFVDGRKDVASHLIVASFIPVSIVLICTIQVV